VPPVPPKGTTDHPSYNELVEKGTLTYPIKEPYQSAILRYAKNEVTYAVVEPVLTEKERGILERVEGSYEILVNMDTVLVDSEDRLRFVENAFDDLADIFGLKLSDDERKRILYYVERDFLGFGKIDALVNDKFIEDISCNGPAQPIYIYHRFFESIRTSIAFEELELNGFILRLAQLSGRHISILQPIRDAALPDGSRINMTLGKEVTKKGSTFTIRKFKSEPMSPIELLLSGTGDAKIFGFLWLVVEYGNSILISGGTASGKTTTLNAISMLIRTENKIVSIEDTPEINLAHPNWVQAVTRIGFGEQASISGISGISGVSRPGGGKSAGDISLYDLLIAALRQRPDYIIVGEVRGEEAYTLFQAISVGHAALGTIHAASMVELLARVESAPMNVPRVLMANIDLVIFMGAVKKEGTMEKVRRMRDIVEVLGVDPERKEVVTNELFKWDPAEDGFDFTGRSFLIEKLANKLGLRKEELYAEVTNRTKVLEWMKRKGITHYEKVTEIVGRYYTNPKEVLEECDRQDT